MPLKQFTQPGVESTQDNSPLRLRMSGMDQSNANTAAHTTMHGTMPGQTPKGGNGKMLQTFNERSPGAFSSIKDRSTMMDTSPTFSPKMNINDGDAIDDASRKV